MNTRSSTELLSATRPQVRVARKLRHYPKLQYERLYRDTRNPSIFGFKNFRVFRVFRGQRIFKLVTVSNGSVHDFSVPSSRAS